MSQGRGGDDDTREFSSDRIRKGYQEIHKIFCFEDRENYAEREREESVCVFWLMEEKELEFHKCSLF